MNKRRAVIVIFVLCAVMLSSQTDSTSKIIEEQGRRIDLIKTNLDYVWVVLSAMLVFFMQAGFMALESGMARSKNSINVAIKNLTDFVLGVVGFWLIGFGLMFGKSHHGLVGTTDFLITIENPWTAAFFIFQAVFVGTAATIDSGAVCERAKLKQYVLLSFLMSVFIYPIFGHWAWGSFLHGADPATGGAGWLEARGFKDFAGSSVVHSVGGWMALAGILVVGPRLGKFEVDPVSGKKRANKIAPGDMRFVFLGTFILFFGWYGFNCGSTLSATADIATIALNTTLAACFGCLVSSVLSWITHPEKKIEGEMIANGVLAGLVGITAGCAFVDTVSSAIIGAVAGVIVYLGTILLEKVLKLDDVVGAIPVHGMCGAWGTLAVGIFIRPELLDGMTRMDQIGIQALGVAVCFVWAFGLGFVFYKLTDLFLGGVRVSREEEIMGLNIAEHGARSAILELAHTMDNLTRSGDFSGDEKVHEEQGTEIGDLARLFNNMIDKVKEALGESRKQKLAAESMLKETNRQKSEIEQTHKMLNDERDKASRERHEYIGQTREKLAQVIRGIGLMKDTMGATSQVTDTMKENFDGMNGSLEEMLRFLGDISSRLGSMKEITHSSSHSVSTSKVTVEDLKEVTLQVGAMVNYINDIAEKTHILSINSRIEAARAGQQGKGFVVISDEVMELSQETSRAANEIREMISDMESRVSRVVDSMDGITRIMGDINGLNGELISLVESNSLLSNALNEQTKITAAAVSEVAGDISLAVEKSENLSLIGSTVEKDLEQI
ncbi:MAG: ammonium transporter [Spirochaetales bacterium]|nr:ammonium transporter [Spirochaetales bacterium]